MTIQGTLVTAMFADINLTLQVVEIGGQSDSAVNDHGRVKSLIHTIFFIKIP